MSTPAQAPAAAPISFPAKKRKAATTKSAAKSKKTCIAPTISSHPKGKYHLNKVWTRISNRLLIPAVTLQILLAYHVPI